MCFMKKLLVGISVLATGCTSLSTDLKLVTEGSEISELKVFRESAFQNGAISMYVGESDKYFLRLSSGQHGSVKMNSGVHTIQAKADASPSSSIEIELKPNETTCLKGSPNKAALGAVVIPIVGNMVPSFVLTEIKCPADQAEEANGSRNS